MARRTFLRRPVNVSSPWATIHRVSTAVDSLSIVCFFLNFDFLFRPTWKSGDAEQLPPVRPATKRFCLVIRRVGNCSFARHFRFHTPFDWKSGRRSWIWFRLFCHRLRFEHQLLSLPLEFSSRFISRCPVRLTAEYCVIHTERWDGASPIFLHLKVHNMNSTFVGSFLIAF